MRLALAFGEPDVNKFLSGITQSQFLEWVAFDRVEPIGGKRLDWTAAHICKWVALVSGKVENRPAGDFMLHTFGDEEEPADPVVIEAQMKYHARQVEANKKARRARREH